MVTKTKELEVATFRFGIISEFVTGVCLARGEKEKLINMKAMRKYKIPYSSQTSISKSTIKKWIRDYTSSGSIIQGLYPKSRKDNGHFRSLNETIQMAIRSVMSDKPSLTGVALINELHHRKYLLITESINLSVLYRFLKKEKLLQKSTLTDRRSFEADSSNVMWQSDVMHGPKVLLKNKRVKAYLIAIMDDHSRLIIHAKFYPSESLSYFKKCLQDGVTKRGIPQKLYVDNGSCYKALNLEQIGACLQFAVVHTPPYTPEGRGKIERWFRYVRTSFLPICPEKMTMDELNELFENWVQEYQERIHSVTKQTPLKRYQSNMKCVRPAPDNLIDYFRIIQFRRVKRDRTFQLSNQVFEAPVCLINKRIEVKYQEDKKEDIEIFFDDLSYGKATLLNRTVNYTIGRTQTISYPEKTDISPSELFGGVK
jgi:transposase InsO family protein